MRLEDQIIARNMSLGSNCKRHILHISEQAQRSSFYKRYAEYPNNKIVATISVDCRTVDSLVEDGETPPTLLRLT